MIEARNHVFRVSRVKGFSSDLMQRQVQAFYVFGPRNIHVYSMKPFFVHQLVVRVVKTHYRVVALFQICFYHPVVLWGYYGLGEAASEGSGPEYLD